MDWTPDRLRALRAALGITQVELAYLIDYSASAVGLWESGQRRPGARACQLLDALVERADRL